MKKPAFQIMNPSEAARVAEARRPALEEAPPPDAPADELPLRGLMVRKRDGREVVRVTTYLKPATAVALREHCFRRQLDQSDFISRAVDAAVARLK